MQRDNRLDAVEKGLTQAQDRMRMFQGPRRSWTPSQKLQYDEDRSGLLLVQRVLQNALAFMGGEEPESREARVRINELLENLEEFDSDEMSRLKQD